MASNNYIRLLESSEYSDLKLVVGAGKEVFQVHRAIVCTKSQFLATACTRGKQADVHLPKIQPSILRIILNWMYQGTFNFDADTSHILPKIFITADDLGIEGLKNDIQSFLEKDFDLNERERVIQDRFGVTKELFYCIAEEKRGSLSELGRKLVEGNPDLIQMSRFFDKNSRRSFDAFIAEYYFTWMAEKLCRDCQKMGLGSHGDDTKCACCQKNLNEDSDGSSNDVMETDHEEESDTASNQEMDTDNENKSEESSDSY